MSKKNNFRNVFLISMGFLGLILYQVPVFASKLTISFNAQGILIPQICAWNASGASLCPSKSNAGGCASGPFFSYDTKLNKLQNVCFSAILSFLGKKIQPDTSCSESGFVAGVKKTPLGAQLYFYGNGSITGGVRLQVNVAQQGSTYVASCKYQHTK